MLRIVLLAVLCVLRKTMWDFGLQVNLVCALLMWAFKKLGVGVSMSLLTVPTVKSFLAPWRTEEPGNLAAGLLLCFGWSSFTGETFVAWEPVAKLMLLSTCLHRILSDDFPFPPFSKWRSAVVSVCSNHVSWFTAREDSEWKPSQMFCRVGNRCCLLTVNLRRGSPVSLSLEEVLNTVSMMQYSETCYAVWII